MMMLPPLSDDAGPVDVPARPSAPTSEWSHQMADAIAAAPDAQERASLVLTLVNDLYETVEWVLGPHLSVELVSLRRVVEEAVAHHLRLATTP